MQISNWENWLREQNGWRWAFSCVIKDVTSSDGKVCVESSLQIDLLTSNREIITMRPPTVGCSYPDPQQRWGANLHVRKSHWLHGCCVLHKCDSLTAKDKKMVYDCVGNLKNFLRKGLILIRKQMRHRLWLARKLNSIDETSAIYKLPTIFQNKQN